MFFIGLLRNFALTLIRVYEFILIARCLMSWFPMMQGNAIFTFVYSITEPLLAPIRACLHKIPALSNFPLDFSILVLFLIFDVLRMAFI